MIVIPFHHACRNIFGIMAIRIDDGDVMLVAPSHHYPPGSCIQ